MISQACCPGSYDPITRGHIALIEDAAACFGSLVVAVGGNPSKAYLFSLEERLELARAALAHLPNVQVVPYRGMLVGFLAANNLTIVVRGIRNAEDLADNLKQDDIGHAQPDGATFKVAYIPASPAHRLTSSTSAKVVVKNQGDASAMLTPAVCHATRTRLLNQYVFGITGQSGTGKSYIAQQFAILAQARGLSCLHIDLDTLAHHILGTSALPRHAAIREALINRFGPSVRAKNGAIDRKALGKLVFADTSARHYLDDLLGLTLRAAVREQLLGATGLVVVEGALLAEHDYTSLVDSHLLLLEADFATRLARLSARDGTDAATLEQRDASQQDAPGKAATLQTLIARAGYGTLQRLNTSGTPSPAAIEQAFTSMLSAVDIHGALRQPGQ